MSDTPKPILFETGSGDPPLQSQVHPVSIARIGQLVILALPAEVTTMAGRRLRASVQRELGSWAQHVVLAGYANGYSGYITTPEEYMLQQYEAAHTLHGRWTLPAYQQVGSARNCPLAVATMTGAANPPASHCLSAPRVQRPQAPASALRCQWRKACINPAMSWWRSSSPPTPRRTFPQQPPFSR